MIQVVLRLGLLHQASGEGTFSPFLSLFGMLQCEVPRGHNFLSHVAAALNLDRSGMESARRAAPSPGEALLPTPFPVRELGDTRSWSSSEPRPHQHTRSSSDTLNSSGFLCMPEGGSTCLDTLSRTLTWTYHTFSPVLQHANTYIVQCVEILPSLSFFSPHFIFMLNLLSSLNICLCSMSPV